MIIYNLFWELDFIFFRKNPNNLFFYKNSFYKKELFFTNTCLYVLNTIIIKYIIFLSFFSVLFNLIFYFFSKHDSKKLNESSLSILNFISLLSFVLSTLLVITFLYIYVIFFNLLNIKQLNNNFIINPNFYFFGLNLHFDFFGIVLLFISYITGFLSLCALDNKMLFKNSRYFSLINIFVLIVFFYILTNNILILFIFYEFLLVPSFLLVFFLSPSRKAIQASLYFVIWTQIGSFIVLCVVFYIIVVTGSSDFFIIKNYVFNKNEIFLLSFLTFLGFGFKIPIWPFHYWLTKTHVEAPSGFSMYLSGFLVKTALYGFYKIINLFGGEVNSILFSSICLVGVVDASLKMWGQTDLKRLVAYGTVQEMNLIYFTFCWGDSKNIISGVLFCLTHSLLSTLMFYIVDCIYRRYNSRSVIELSGIIHKTPNLGIIIILMCVLYSGLPGTLKFTSEFFIFTSFFEIAPLSTIFIIFIANCLGLLGFSKCWFNVVFGMSMKNNNQLILDLTIKELYILISTIFFLILFCFLPNLYF